MHISPPQTEHSTSQPFAWPIARLLFGATLLLTAWTLCWFGPARISTHTFFPLWLGYILLVDSIVEARSGASLWTRNRVAFVTLFVVSMPLWWLFEAANSTTWRG